MKFIVTSHAALPCVLAAALAAAVAGCSSNPSPPTHAPVTAKPESTAEALVAAAAQRSVEPGVTGQRVSQASNPKSYREDAASHLYGLNRDRIYKGRLPPLLYAVGVLQVEVDRQGNVDKLHWMRAPSHAPEVVKEIERTVRAAAPFPAPACMGKVVYTDTWLWHKSGRFQLDTLTEGQD